MAMEKRKIWEIVKVTIYKVTDIRDHTLNHKIINM